MKKLLLLSALGLALMMPATSQAAALTPPRRVRR
jgi:hypothetical protein